jgi:hypothetical protein
MIYFTIPSSSGLVVSNTNINIDRDPQSQSDLNMLSFKAELSGTSQNAPNGVNTRDEQFSFSIKNVPMATALIINQYFNLLKTGNLTIVFPEGSKNYYIDNWSIVGKNLLYADVLCNCELMYL